MTHRSPFWVSSVASALCPSPGRACVWKSARASSVTASRSADASAFQRGQSTAYISCRTYQPSSVTGASAIGARISRRTVGWKAAANGESRTVVVALKSSIWIPASRTACRKDATRPFRRSRSIGMRDRCSDGQQTSRAPGARRRVRSLHQRARTRMEGHIMQLKSLARLLCALTALVAFAGIARAQECKPACSKRERACYGTANVAMLACKATCRASAKRTEVGACTRACSATYTKAKATCRTDVVSCRNACKPSPVACRGLCGQSLAACTKAVVTKQQGCIRACKTASDRPGCVSSCVATAKAEDAACAASFQDCTAKCGGSPSGAFIEGEGSLF